MGQVVWKNSEGHRFSVCVGRPKKLDPDVSESKQTSSSAFPSDLLHLRAARKCYPLWERVYSMDHSRKYPHRNPPPEGMSLIADLIKSTMKNHHHTPHSFLPLVPDEVGFFLSRSNRYTL